MPVYVYSIWMEGKRQFPKLASFLIVCILPLVISCLPFIFADAEAFLKTLARGQQSFGPLATINFIAPMLDLLFSVLGKTIDLYQVNLAFLIATGLGAIVAYLYVVRRHISLLDANLLVLMIFFLLYPKVHGLYTVAFLPFALVRSYRTASSVWIPGLIWMLLVNGTFEANGFLYWLAPLLGVWIPIGTSLTASVLTIYLSGVQFLWLVKGIKELLNRSMKSRMEFG